jgi:ubiquinone/menaquinone biosynthesis C-methylase UbiE
METIQDLFYVGMSRLIPDLLAKDGGLQVNVGAGTYKTLLNAEPIDYPKWDARIDQLPYEDDSVDVIHCYHFLEHMEDPAKTLLDFQRVLKVGGYANIVVPYYNSHLQAKCLDHKSMFNESTWDNLFNQYSYNNLSGTWRLKVHTTFIMGVEEKNLALLTQLVKI